MRLSLPGLSLVVLLAASALPALADSPAVSSQKDAPAVGAASAGTPSAGADSGSPAATAPASDAAGTASQPADAAGAAAPSADGSTAPASNDNSTGSSTPSTDATGGAAASPENAVFDGTIATDDDLSQIVLGAYTGAYNQALKHGNYFSSDDLPFADLRAAIRRTLDKEGYGAANVETDPAADAGAAKLCATDGKIDVRVAFASGGTGISIAVVSADRMVAYDYDPSTSSDLAITSAQACAVKTDAGDVAAPADSGNSNNAGASTGAGSTDASGSTDNGTGTDAPTTRSGHGGAK